MKDKQCFFVSFFIFFSSFVFAEQLYSPTWGFNLDLPEGYEYTGGDRNERFSFAHNDGAKFDLVVYAAPAGRSAPYASVEALAEDVNRRLSNRGKRDSFYYRQKKAVLLELSFSGSGAGGRTNLMNGWALCVELGKDVPRSTSNTRAAPPLSPSGRETSSGPRPLLLAMAYGPAGRQDLQALHFSALDSVSPEEGDRFVPGAVTEFTYPRETRVQVPLFALGLNAWIYREDAEAAQAVVDREFQVLRRYVNAPNWKEAWIRFYRAIYRDSFDRLADAAFQIERNINVPPKDNRDFAEEVLKWVQSFNYERNLLGSDFVNLVSAATEGRGDCDSRAMLWAVVLKQAAVPSAMMVSRSYSHALGIADLEGGGARFPMKDAAGRDIRWLVAETTDQVSIGLIAVTVSEIDQWLGIQFE